MSLIILIAIYLIGYIISYYYITKWGYVYTHKWMAMDDVYRGYEEKSITLTWCICFIWMITFPFIIVLRLFKKKKEKDELVLRELEQVDKRFAEIYPKI